jgi:GNAT superfamily N-acetyltransferase
MEIVEYDHADPLKVFYLNQLTLDYPLTPELAARIRLADARPFPCFAIYAVEDDQVIGQVGIFRLPIVSTQGREEVGGIWAVAVHPHYTDRGVGSILLDEAHNHMRDAGLRFSTICTDRHHMDYRLYRLHGYEDTRVWATAQARWSTAHQPTRLQVKLPDMDGYEIVEDIFMEMAKDYLGFARRQVPFARLHQESLSDIRILHENTRFVGYALTEVRRNILKISNLLLERGVEAAEAIAAIAAELKTDFVQVKISRPTEIASLKQAGYQIAYPDWEAFMIKPLVPEATIEDARKLFGIGTDRFLISWMDTAL